MYNDGDYRRMIARSAKNLDHSKQYRDHFHEDVARLVHSPSYRRMMRKRQLLPSENSDFVRNRLTHSNEVAQVATSMGQVVNPQIKDVLHRRGSVSSDLLIFAGLAHDIGHPPFGHLGEQALNDRMYDSGGFEGNAQTLRVISKLERRLTSQLGSDSRIFVDHAESDGLNPTYRSLASVLKYPKVIPVRNVAEKEILRRPKVQKGFYEEDSGLVRAIHKNVFGREFAEEVAPRTIECQIMDLADDICYSIYDLEDCFKTGIMSPETFLTVSEELLTTIAVDVAEKLQYDTRVRVPGDKTLAGDWLKEKIDASLVSRVILRFLKVLWDPNSEEELVGASERPEAFLRAYARLHDRSVSLAKDGKFRRRLTESYIAQNVCAVTLVRGPSDLPSSACRLQLPLARILEIEVLKRLNFHLVIQSDLIKTSEYRGEEIVKSVFDSLFLPGDEFKIEARFLTGYHLLPADIRRYIDTVYANQSAEVAALRSKIEERTVEAVHSNFPYAARFELDYMLKFGSFDFRYSVSDAMYLAIEKTCSGPHLDKARDLMKQRRVAVKRLICDFIAGMTDRGLLEYYNRLKSEDQRVILDEFTV